MNLTRVEVNRCAVDRLQLFRTAMTDARLIPSSRAICELFLPALCKRLTSLAFACAVAGRPCGLPSALALAIPAPATRARNVRYRVAASSGWKARFTLMWDMTVVSRGEMEAVVRDAGMLAGLGDGRSIGFGRFRIEGFDISANDD